MTRMDVLLLIQPVMGILMLIILHKVMQLKKQVNHIVKQVEDYVTYITSETEAEEQHQEQKKANILLKKDEKVDEAQSRLIQAVLGEYFS